MKKDKKLFSFLTLAIAFCVCLSLLIINVHALSFTVAVEDGGGVYVESGTTYTMSGGKIDGKTAQGMGGGVYAGGIFNMTSGTISNNEVSYNNSGSSYGGGVCVVGTFNMSGGTISNNTALLGGGVCIYYQGTFNMTGGTIKDNTATSHGDAIAIKGTFNYTSGTINGEIYCESSGTIVYKGQPSSTQTINVGTPSVGTKIAKLDGISTIDLTKLNVVNMPENCELQIQTISGEKWVVVGEKIQVQKATVIISVNKTDYGSVSKIKLTVDIGTSISSSGSVLYVGSETIIATPNSGYAFDYWDYGGVSTVSGDMTIKVYFKEAEDIGGEDDGPLRVGLIGLNIEDNNGYYSPIWSELVFTYAAARALDGEDLTIDILNENDVISMDSYQLMSFLIDNYGVEFVNFPILPGYNGDINTSNRLIDGEYGPLLDYRTYQKFMKANNLDIVFSDLFWRGKFDETEIRYLYNYCGIGDLYVSGYADTLHPYFDDFTDLGPVDFIMGTASNYGGGGVDDFINEGVDAVYIGGYSMPSQDNFYTRLFSDFIEHCKMLSSYSHNETLEFYDEQDRFIYDMIDTTGSYNNFVAFAPIGLWYDLYSKTEFSFSQLRGGPLVFGDYFSLGEYAVGGYDSFIDMITLGVVYKTVFLDVNGRIDYSLTSEFINEFRNSGLAIDYLRKIFLSNGFQQEFSVSFINSVDEFNWNNGYDLIRSWDLTYDFINYNQFILDTKKYFLEPIVDKSKK